jgi:alkylation response protein AidB-like acyl-CoA dehydrogenase
MERGRLSRPRYVSPMDLALSPEQELIRKTAREFVEREVVPFARQWDRDEEMDRGIVAKLAEVGFLGAGLPEDYGGMGLDTVSYCLVTEELGRADSSVRGIVSVQNGLAGKTIARWGTEEQKREWLPRLASGDALGCYALTEPGAGSDPGSLATRAERDGDGWTISGSKIFITMGTWAGLALVFARTGDAISCFLVPTDSAGFSASALKGKLGLRAQDTGELSLDAVRVDGDALLGGEGEGMKVALSALDNGRISLAAGCVGIAQGCLDACLAYARERRQFGRSIASFQLVQELLAEIAVETDAARLLTWRAALAADSGERHTLESSIAKYYASEAAVRAANAAVQIHGGYGYVDEYPVGKYLRDARVTTLYEGTSQIQKLIIGRQLTGESAFA